MIIGTSNLGSRKLIGSRSLGFGEGKEKPPSHKVARRLVLEEARKYFKPEFLNRVDELIVFHSLDENDVRSVARLLVDRLARRLKERDIILDVAEEVLDKIAKDGFNPVYGARPLRREIEKQIEDALAPRILMREFARGDVIKVRVKDGKIVFDS